jgi:hypothetical protein
VIASYRALLDHLAAIRAHGRVRTGRSAGVVAQPTYMDPFRLFASYPTQMLSGSTRLVAGPMRVADLPLGIEDAAIVRHGLAASTTLAAMIEKAAHPIELADLVGAFPGQDRRMLTISAAFLLKMGLLARA